MKDLGEDDVVSREGKEGGGGGGQSSPTECKVGLYLIDCQHQFTTNEGGRVIRIFQGLMRGSGKFYRDTTDILQPPPTPPQMITMVPEVHMNIFFFFPRPLS